MRINPAERLRSLSLYDWLTVALGIVAAAGLGYAFIATHSDGTKTTFEDVAARSCRDQPYIALASPDPTGKQDIRCADGRRITIDRRNLGSEIESHK